MKISGRFVKITETKFVPDRLVIFEGEAITFKLELLGSGGDLSENRQDKNVYQVSILYFFFQCLLLFLRVITGYPRSSYRVPQICITSNK